MTGMGVQNFLEELLKKSAINNLNKNYLLFEFSIVKLLATMFLHIIPKKYYNNSFKDIKNKYRKHKNFIANNRL
jgi:hypothetical protein